MSSLVFFAVNADRPHPVVPNNSERMRAEPRTLTVRAQGMVMKPEKSFALLGTYLGALSLAYLSGIFACLEHKQITMIAERLRISVFL